MPVFREIDTGGKMRYVPCLTVSWMGVDLWWGWGREREEGGLEMIAGGRFSFARYLSRRQEDGRIKARAAR